MSRFLMILGGFYRLAGAPFPTATCDSPSKLPDFTAQQKACFTSISLDLVNASQTILKGGTTPPKKYNRLLYFLLRIQHASLINFYIYLQLF
ncbi:hypothetical protein ACFX15_030561 [Malus domestica]